MRWDFILFFASLVVASLGEWGLYIGIAGMAASLAHGILKKINDLHARKLVMIFGLIASGVVFVSLLAFSLRPGWFGFAEDKDKTERQRSALNQQIKMDCSYGFVEMPLSRSYWELIIDRSIPPMISFQHHQYPPTVGLIKFPERGYKCMLTNYSGHPIFNVKATIKFQFVEAIWEGTGAHGGAIVSSPAKEISIDKVEGIGQNVFEFFIWNYSDFFVTLEIPKIIELQRLGSDKRENAELIAPSRPFESLSPKDREFTTKTVRQLLSLYEGRTPLQADKLLAPDKQKWITVGAIVETLLPEGERSIGVLKSESDTIECRFRKYWKEKLNSLKKGDTIKVIGKISNTQNGSQLYLSDCEIVSS